MKRLINIKLTTLLVIFVFLGGCASAGKMKQSLSIYEKVVTLESGIKLRYAISIPKSYSRGKPVPLTLALHYGGRVTPFYGKGFLTLLVEPALKKLGAIIVAPDCPGRSWTNSISEEAVMDLMSHIKSEYKIDSSRVVITGYSMGGIGTWYIAARHPHFFSAAIPISALPDPKTIPIIKDIPFYVIHSLKDEVFPIDSVKSFVDRQKSRGAAIHLVEVDGISHYETHRFVKPLKDAIPWIKKIWGHFPK